MSDYKVHYPSFDVLHEQEHWDPHTREIVNQRLRTESFYPHHFLNTLEAEYLSRLCSILLDEERYEVIAYVVHHFDSVLKADIGESQRKVGVPKQSELIRTGLDRLDKVCIERYRTTFAGLEKGDQEQLVSDWMNGKVSSLSGSEAFPVTEFMNIIHNESVAAYYSHPSIWSEIGYAGPAYPRGYIRSEFGLTDPWEARRDGK